MRAVRRPRTSATFALQRAARILAVDPPGAQRAIALACPGAPDPTFPLADLDPYDATPAQRAALAAALARGA